MIRKQKSQGCNFLPGRWGVILGSPEIAFPKKKLLFYDKFLLYKI